MRTLIVFLLLILTCAAVPSPVLAGTQETVYVETASNGSAVIVRSNSDRYLIEYGPGFPDLPNYVGLPVRVQYLDYFLDMQSLIMTPDDTETGQVARIWRAEFINFTPAAPRSQKHVCFQGRRHQVQRQRGGTLDGGLAIH